MTKTALENKRINAQKEIADKDREQRKKEFKHKKTMDIISFFKPGKIAFPKSTHNDPKWYKSYVDDLNKFTNITTFIRNGVNTYDGKFRFSASGNTTYNHSVPGIMVYKWVPSINTSKYVGDTISMEAINQILMRTKEQVLKSNSRSSVPYEAADLGFNFLATASILEAIAEFERMVLVAQTYKADNGYYNRAYLSALGGSDSWNTNLADARKYLVLLKKRFNSALVAPAGLSIYNKFSYLGSSWMKDSEVHPASVYCFVANYFLKLNNDGSQLEPIVPIRTTPTLFYQQISEMIQAIAENPDYVEMYADLRSAVSNLVQLDTYFDSSSEIEENHDSMAMEQIANIRTLPLVYGDSYQPAGIDTETLRIKQTTSGYLYQGLTVNDTGIKFKYDTSEHVSDIRKALNYLGEGSTFINFHKDEVDGDDVLDASRGLIAYKYDSSNVDDEEIIFKVTDSDMCLVMYASITTLRYSTSNGSTQVETITNHAGSEYINTNLTAVSAFSDALLDISLLTHFDWHPIVRYVSVLSGEVVYVTPLGDVQKLVPVGFSTISDINQACGLGLMYLDTDQFKIAPR